MNELIVKYKVATCHFTYIYALTMSVMSSIKYKYQIYSSQQVRELYP